MPTLVEVLTALSEANDALSAAASEAGQARQSYNEAADAKATAETRLNETKAAHGAALAALDQLI